VLKKLNVHGLIWLGNDTVSLWHGILYGMVLVLQPTAAKGDDKHVLFLVMSV